MYPKNSSFSFELKMHRSQHSRKRQLSSSSFTKFVARLQHTFTTKSIKSSTPIVQQQISVQPRLAPLPTFPSFSNYNYSRCRLSQILYDPTRQVEYLSEIEEKADSDISTETLPVDDNDSCYDSMSDHQHDRMNLSQMNISMDNVYHRQSQPTKALKLPSSLLTARFHSTAIGEMGSF